MTNSAEFDLCYNFWHQFYILGSMTWNIRHNKITITSYFNDENVDIEVMSYMLNKTVRETPRLLENGWQPNFKMTISSPEPWIMDYYKKVAFVLKK